MRILAGPRHRSAGLAPRRGLTGRNSPRKVARGARGGKRPNAENPHAGDSVLQRDQNARQQLGEIVRAGGKHRGRDGRIGTEILNSDPELDRRARAPRKGQRYSPDENLQGIQSGRHRIPLSETRSLCKRLAWSNADWGGCFSYRSRTRARLRPPSSREGKLPQETRRERLP